MVPLPQSAGNVVLVEVVVVELVLVVGEVEVLLELVLDVVVVFPGCVFLGYVVVVVGDPVVVVGRAAEAGWATRRSVHAKTL